MPLSERIPRSKLRGMRANIKLTEFLTVEDSLELAARSFNKISLLKNFHEISGLSESRLIPESPESL